ncbi:MAG: ribonuclease [Verrucomicrobiota bacterium]
MPNLADLQNRLGYSFLDEELLRLALTHPSVAHESPVVTTHNQRLEFLGDAVLGLVLTGALYERFPSLGEGPLTKARAQLVNRRTLATEARRIGLGAHLLVSHGEESSGGRERQSALADAYEALLGAIFIDGGYNAAAEFILRSFRDMFGSLTAVPILENPKGELQEFLQSTSPAAPRYELIGVTGPDHDRIFECAVYHGGNELGRGSGKSKKEAESCAAVAALQKLRMTAGTPSAGTRPVENQEAGG